MATDKADLSEPDRFPGAPHPRERAVLFGHEAAEEALLDGYRAGRLHHAILIGGPQGIGKATLAYRFARFLLAGGRGPSLAVDPASTTARQVSALSHPNLAVLRRTPATEKKGPSTTIPVDSVRKALGLFGSTAADSGYRICIVDSAEDLIPASANALLKMIEEPPPRSLFLIVSHAPQRVLPTIRSRCRRLLLRPLEEADLRRVIASLGEPFAGADPETIEAALPLAEGSARRAIEMLSGPKRALVETVTRLLRELPRIEIERVLALAEALAKRDAEEDWTLALDTVDRWVSGEIAARAASGPARLAPLAEVCEKIARAARDVDVYNLDRRPLVVSLFGELAEAVRGAG